MIDLRAVNQSQFVGAKRYWAAATIGKLTLFILGLWAVLIGTPPESLPQWVLLLAIASELLQLRSDGLKARAESLLRLLDLCQSFGWSISEADKRDIIVTVPYRIRKRFAIVGKADTYFASQEPAGPKRALATLYESAWYSARLARAMAVAYALFIVSLLFASLTALVVTLKADTTPANQDRVVRIVTAWLMLIVSLHMLKMAWSYFRMYERSERTKAACTPLMDGSPSESDALRQWQEYHVARSGSPLIPLWLWKLMEPSLNNAWRAARSGTNSVEG